MKFRDYTEIIFEVGEILSVQMLEETYRYPREFLNLTYKNYCNGILSGLDFVCRDDGVYLTSGIVKFDGRYFILPQDINIDDWLKKNKLLNGVEYYLCIVINESDEKGCGIKIRHQAELKATRDKINNSIILAKYKHRSDIGISLPKLKMNDSENPFEDFFSSGLLQLLECEYSHQQGETTYHPLVFKAMQSYLEKKFPLSPYDFSLLTELQNHILIAMSSLRTYISVNKKNFLSSENMTREKLFREVTECIKIPYTLPVYSDVSEEQDDSKKIKRHSKLI